MPKKLLSDLKNQYLKRIFDNTDFVFQSIQTFFSCFVELPGMKAIIAAHFLGKKLNVSFRGRSPRLSCFFSQCYPQEL